MNENWRPRYNGPRRGRSRFRPQGNFQQGNFQQQPPQNNWNYRPPQQFQQQQQQQMPPPLLNWGYQQQMQFNNSFVRHPPPLMMPPRQRTPPRQRSPSPLPGSEAFIQMKIQQTSQLIQSQVINGKQNDVTLPVSQQMQQMQSDQLHQSIFNNSNETVTKPQRQAPFVMQRQNSSEAVKKNLSVTEIYNKIIDHLANLSYSKKVNLVNLGSAGYDEAIKQIQRQQRLALSRELRDMLNKGRNINDCSVINEIIPDIGIKLEELPKEMIAQLSSTLNVDLVDPSECFQQAHDMLSEHDNASMMDITGSPEQVKLSGSDDIFKKYEHFAKIQEPIENPPIGDENEYDESTSTTTEINNPFDFNYMNTPNSFNSYLEHESQQSMAINEVPELQQLQQEQEDEDEDDTTFDIVIDARGSYLSSSNNSGPSSHFSVPIKCNIRPPPRVQKPPNEDDRPRKVKLKRFDPITQDLFNPPRKISGGPPEMFKTKVIEPKIKVVPVEELRPVVVSSRSPIAEKKGPFEPFVNDEPMKEQNENQSNNMNVRRRSTPDRQQQQLFTNSRENTGRGRRGGRLLSRDRRRGSFSRSQRSMSDDEYPPRRTRFDSNRTFNEKLKHHNKTSPRRDHEHTTNRQEGQEKQERQEKQEKDKPSIQTRNTKETKADSRSEDACFKIPKLHGHSKTPHESTKNRDQFDDLKDKHRQDDGNKNKKSGGVDQWKNHNFSISVRQDLRETKTTRSRDEDGKSPERNNRRDKSPSKSGDKRDKSTPEKRDRRDTSKERDSRSSRSPLFGKPYKVSPEKRDKSKERESVISPTEQKDETSKTIEKPMDIDESPINTKETEQKQESATKSDKEDKIKESSDKKSAKEDEKDCTNNKKAWKSLGERKQIMPITIPSLNSPDDELDFEEMPPEDELLESSAEEPSVESQGDVKLNKSQEKPKYADGLPKVLHEEMEEFNKKMAVSAKIDKLSTKEVEEIIPPTVIEAEPEVSPIDTSNSEKNPPGAEDLCKNLESIKEVVDKVNDTAVSSSTEKQVDNDDSMETSSKSSAQEEDKNTGKRKGPKFNKRQTKKSKLFDPAEIKAQSMKPLFGTFDQISVPQDANDTKTSDSKASTSKTVTKKVESSSTNSALKTMCKKFNTSTDNSNESSSVSSKVSSRKTKESTDNSSEFYNSSQTKVSQKKTNVKDFSENSNDSNPSVFKTKKSNPRESDDYSTTTKVLPKRTTNTKEPTESAGSEINTSNKKQNKRAYPEQNKQNDKEVHKKMKLLTTIKRLEQIDNEIKSLLKEQSNLHNELEEYLSTEQEPEETRSVCAPEPQSEPESIDTTPVVIKRKRKPGRKPQKNPQNEEKLQPVEDRLTPTLPTKSTPIVKSAPRTRKRTSYSNEPSDTSNSSQTADHETKNTSEDKVLTNEKSGEKRKERAIKTEPHDGDDGGPIQMPIIVQIESNFKEIHPPGSSGSPEAIVAKKPHRGRAKATKRIKKIDETNNASSSSSSPYEDTMILTHKIKTFDIRLIRYTLDELHKLAEEVKLVKKNESQEQEQVVQQVRPEATTLRFTQWTGSIISIKVLENEVYAGNDLGILYCYHLSDGHLIREQTVCKDAITSIVSYTETPDTKPKVLVGSLDSLLSIVNDETKNVEKTVHIDVPVQCLETSWNYVFLGTPNGYLMNYDIKHDKLGAPIAINNQSVLVIKATQEGARRVLIVACKNSHVTVRDAMSGLLLRTMEDLFTPTVYSLLLHNNLIYCGTSQHNVLVYSFYEGNVAHKFEEAQGSGAVSLSIFKNLLFVGCYNGIVYVYDIENSKKYLTSITIKEGMILTIDVIDYKIIVSTKQHCFKCLPLPETVLGCITTT